ncbi:MAG: hypothetical protein D6715_12505 [Calditrichaeota bacterium]|nr:MAG: hypothetical protein D6715_12505 [Calditrichota bacterium]
MASSSYNCRWITLALGIGVFCSTCARRAAVSDGAIKFGLPPKRSKELDTEETTHAFGFPVDPRCYNIADVMLRQLGVKSVRLLTNNPRKILGLEKHGIQILERIPLEAPVNELNRDYLRTRARKGRRLLQLASGLADRELDHFKEALTAGAKKMKYWMAFYPFIEPGKKRTCKHRLKKPLLYRPNYESQIFLACAAIKSGQIKNLSPELCME